MALSTATVWEVRPTVGADTNGGGFVAGASGTDFSQQNTAQYSFTDLAVDSVTNTIVSSASHNFVAADVGNLINISAGGSWTLGFYQIVSVAANKATLDRSPAATSTTGGTYAVGGALNTISKAYGAAALQNTVYVKATGNYTVSATLTLTGENPTPFTFIGYTTTRGDGGHATWTTATNSTPLLTAGGSNPANFLFQNFTFTNTAGTKAEVLSGGASSQAFLISFRKCVFDGVKSASTAYVGGTFFNLPELSFDSCEIKNCSSHGVACSPGTSFVACIIHDNTSDGIHVTAVGSGFNNCHEIYLERTVLYNNGAKGINIAEALPLVGNAVAIFLVNSAILNSVSDGVFITAQTGNPIYANLFFMNAIIDSNGGFGVNNAALSLGAFRDYNSAWRANTSGDVNGTGVVKGSGDITLTADPFTNRASLDFTLNSTAGGGLSCRAAGFPSSLA
jgi:hypothetical protein